MGSTSFGPLLRTLPTPGSTSSRVQVEAAWLGLDLPPAYRPQKWMDALDARILLDVLASYVNEGGEAEMTMIYPDTLESFGPDSKHFVAACQGQAGAGAHYQQAVAGGLYAHGE